MAHTPLVRLLPEAPRALLRILDGGRGPVPAPIRAEIFGAERFAQHGRSLAESHRAEAGARQPTTFFPRLRQNIVTLREAHQYIGLQAESGYDISPAGEWLLDNFHLIEAQLKAIHEGLPRRYFRDLPVLQDEPLAGLPRVYGVAWAFVAHTDGAFDEELALRFLKAYQETRELRLAELWALPTTLRVVLIENLRRLAERVATTKAARELANLCSDRLHTFSIEALDELLAELDRRGVGRTFLGQMAQRLQDVQRTSDPLALMPYQQWLQSALPDLASLRAQQAADQAADNLSVSNAVVSLRSIGDADWPEVIAHSSTLMQLLLDSPVFAAEHTGTRDCTLHGIERLARRSGKSETAVARIVLRLMRNADPETPEAGAALHWLEGPGRPALLEALSLREDRVTACRAWGHRWALPLYLASVLLGVVVVVWLALGQPPPAGARPASWGLLLLAALLMFFPASEAVVAVINRLVSESVRPRHLARLAFNEGIPPEHRVMVVIPCLLSGEAETRALVHRLRLHHLANPERHVQFALLTDWQDAPAAHVASDERRLREAATGLQELNRQHPAAEGDPPRFLLLHRAREFSETEQCFIGWERKRGKLEQLITALASGERGPFAELGELSRIAPDTRYVLTLDSDTQLPPGRLRELVGVAAHPQHQPQVDEASLQVHRGYGIVQPRIATPLPSPRELTPFHRLFAGQPGIDPYSTPSSEVYQDLFGEGTYIGKGLLHVQALHAVLHERLPEGLVLSHDLLEGSIARCATVTDLALIEDAPFHADVAASRIHRWIRGDWQLLPIFFSTRLYPMRAVNRWKMFDNLRRSLVAPASLALLVLMLSSRAVSPVATIVLVLAAFCAGPLLGALAGLAPSRDDVALRHFYRGALRGLARAACAGAWHLAMLLQHALLAGDAIARALHRMFVSGRRLMEWTTSAAAAATAERELGALVLRHWHVPAAAAALLAVLLLARVPHPWLACAACALWAASPLWTWWVSRPQPRREDQGLPPDEQARLEGIARDTWRLFERCVGPEDRHLPPDNLQTLPHDMVAHRTSPTNIGLYLLSACCARSFGWIGTQELAERLEATLDTLDGLQRHRGHFLNWYDTQSGATLLPLYVSTVDSGNLCGHLLAVAQACRERAPAPFDDQAQQRALVASHARVKPGLRLLPELATESDGTGTPPLARLLGMAHPLGEARRHPSAFGVLLHDALHRHELLSAAEAQDAPRGKLLWRLGDHLATLRSALRDIDTEAEGQAAVHATTQRLLRIAERCEALAWSADFGFLYHRKRHLFHIGFRVAEQQLDAGFYDLLASEARLTSLLAIAKGEVPVNHWASLGRPFYAVGPQAGLRSWSGSMFEYLMPSLVLHEPQGSVLRDAALAAVREQVDFGRAHHVPWGVSESAYAGRDHTLAYQYAPQGVPRLALRRTPPDELVIAPYATALAAQVAPRRASANFSALERLHARARYGYIEALDFTPARLSAGEAYAPVGTFMAHHQGMSIVAIANVLQDGIAQRWGMGHPQVEAVASLLHERAPQQVSRLYEPHAGPPPLTARRGPTLLRELMPGTQAVEPTHLLSNGHYSVALRSNGAGWSRRGAAGITRSRDDALRDAQGSFLYLRLPGKPQLVSLTQHPAPDPDAWYRSVFHADRVCFDAAWSELQAHVTVWVSPEDDIEFRQVELHNPGAQALELELVSAFEVTLADPRADEAHPAFSNLFVRTQWLPQQQALLFERKARLVTEQGLQASHFLAECDTPVLALRAQADRQRFWGRQHGPTRPVGELDELPPAPAGAPGGAVTLDTGLDPMCALGVRLRLAAGARARLTFATTASESAATVRAVIDKYRQPIHVQRASLMSATLTGIRLRSLGLSGEQFAAVQTVTTALALSLSRPRIGPPRPQSRPPDVCDRKLLWRFGISGDRPIVLVSAGLTQSLGLLRTLAQALRVWAWGRVPCDVVVVNAEPASYLMALHREITALRERHEAENAAQPGPPCTGLYLLRADELSAEEMGTLRSLARIRLRADGRPLLHHVQEWVAAHEAAYDERGTVSAGTLRMAKLPREAVQVAQGRFDEGSGEFRFEAHALSRPVRPWINVLSNPGFGGQLSEAGGGYTWAVNSRLNQLTAWSNDPVSDPPSEWFFVQDRKSREAWSITPSAWGDERVVYQVAHGQGYTVVRHQRGDLAVTASWCVDAGSAVKQVWLRLENRGTRTLPLRLAAMVEWMMGAARSDRGTVQTDLVHEGVAGHALTVLTATQADRTAGYGDGTAFLATTTLGPQRTDWTCDRREWFDARGRLVLPDSFGQRHGPGLDPCAALAIELDLEPGTRADRVFLLGYGDSPAAARRLAAEAIVVPPRQRLDEVRNRWDTLLGATCVKTPDPLFDAMVNRWLLYQAVACRLWAKAGFYQAGGATGFRDQLQDAMALAWAAPQMLREQILVAASRQFPEGDVQHWWHAPAGAGVRTHFSDDLLWLPHACAHYLRSGGDAELLDEPVPFLEGPPIPEGAEDAYYTPTIGTQHATVYEHAARTIDRSLRSGTHGLPLMGTGDWNDGMNRVGHEGRGESVWLAWFLCRVIDEFAPIARRRGEGERAARWEAAATGWRSALNGAAWDGQWFKRAFFDDGSPLGSQQNAEGRIDLIAQAWSVLARGEPPALPRIAMTAAEELLVDHDAGLIKLLDPPLQHAEPSAGYIQAYPPGVRENGGQYSHAGVWALMAQAQLASEPGGWADGTELPYRYFCCLSPAHRAVHPTHGAAYGIEPYVMAGDVYTQPPYVGRGGWSWYTGAAAWLHRAAVGSILGLQLEAESLRLRPCLPAHWHQAEITLQRSGRRMRFLLLRGSTIAAREAAQARQGRVLPVGEALRWTDLPADSSFVVPILQETSVAASPEASAQAS